MSALIKSVDAAHSVALRAIPIPAPMPAPSPELPHVPGLDPLIAVLNADLLRAAARIEALESGVAEIEKEAAASATAAEERGKRAGRLEAEAIQSQMLDRLGSGIATALARFEESLSSLDRLAVLVARESLARLVDDPGQRLDLLAGTIRRRLDMLENQAAIRVLVASADFPGGEAVAALAAAIGRPALVVEIGETLRAGECSIVLQLGALEVGVGQQWTLLEGVLLDMAMPGATG